jgi:hypothetical protein
VLLLVDCTLCLNKGVSQQHKQGKRGWVKLCVDLLQDTSAVCQDGGLQKPQAEDIRGVLTTLRLYSSLVNNWFWPAVLNRRCQLKV